MPLPLFSRLFKVLAGWLTHEHPPRAIPLCDYETLSYEIRPCDVLLIEGRSRVSEVIRVITQSPWSHSTLYIGRLHDIENPNLREYVKRYYDDDPNEQLVIEGMLGKGTIVTPLRQYHKDHIRICRPNGISRKDAQRVISYAIGHLGTDYDVRQLLDLARFLFPWSFLPRRWRSSLFNKKAGPTTRTVCSTIIAEAFKAVKFPILPSVRPHDESGIELIHRNPRLITPRDFDYSPYFEIIKYPYISINQQTAYRNLPWSAKDEISNDEEDIFCPVYLPENHKTLNLQEKPEEAITPEDEANLSDADEELNDMGIVEPETKSASRLKAFAKRFGSKKSAKVKKISDKPNNNESFNDDSSKTDETESNHKAANDK